MKFNLECEREEDGRWLAEVSQLPGVLAYGASANEAMAKAGFEAIVEPAFWLGAPRTSVGTFIDYFELMIGWETQRAKQYGIEHFTCIAMNPREANNVPSTCT